VKYNTAGVAQWAIAIIPTNSGGDIVSTATDSTGLYAGGYYNSSTAISLYNGDGSSSIKTLPAQISSYVVKYNTAGAVQWAATITGGSLIYQFATDSTGVYVGGRFTSGAALINADGSASGKSFPTAVVQDAFVLKYNTSGVVQWCAVIQGDSYDETHAVATDSTGIYVSGTYRSTTTTALNNADGSASGKSFGASQGGGGLNTFVVKYNTSGAILWAISIPTQAADDHAIATDSSGGVYATSSYTGPASIALNNGDGSASGKSLPIVGANATNAFIVKYNSTSTGAVQWYTTIPTANTPGYFSTIYGAATDSTGVYITGWYYSGASTISLINGDGSGSGKSLPAPVGGAIPVFVVKLNTTGTVQWALVIQATGDARGAGVATYSTGVYVSGYYSSTATVQLTNGSGSASGKSLPISLGRDGFTVKYDTDGAVQWYTTTRGTSDDKGNTVITDSSGVYTAGYYSSTTAVALPNGV
jgi:hypothetical protein